MDLRPRIDLLGQREHQVVVGDLQGVGALAFAPGLGGLALAARTMAVPAGVVETGLLAAALALQAGLAQSFGTTGQDVVADLPLAGVEGVFLTVGMQRLRDHGGEA